MEAQRIGYIDALRAFAIFCVLWGHCIQQLDNTLVLWQNPVMNLIYSFHMPLFYLLSGFFFKPSLGPSWKDGVKDFAVKKGTRLLLPYLVWCVLCSWISLLHSGMAEGAVFTPLSVIRIVFGWSFWFLRELFISYCLAYAGYKLFRKWVVAAPLCICFALFAPFMETQSFYLPIFFVGIFIKEHYAFFQRHGIFILIASFALFGACLPFWKGEYYYVFPKLFSWRMLKFDSSRLLKGAYRLATGISGSVFFVALFNKICKGNTIIKRLASYGQYTLEIYLLQVIVIETVLTRVIDFQNINIWLYSLLLTPAMAALVFIFCVMVIKTIRKNKIASLMLFGVGRAS